MMQVTLATGPDANHNCIGGTAGLPPAPPPLPPIRVGPQTDGVNAQRVVAVAVYCRRSPACKGVVTLMQAGRRVSVGSGRFSVPAGTTSHVPIRLRPALIGAIRAHGGVSVTLNAVVEAQIFTQTIGIRIF